MRNGICENRYYSLMETAKANSLRLDDDLLHLLSILPERAERNKDFEIDDLLPWSEKRSRGSRQRECWEPRLFCIGGLLSGYCFSEIAVYFLANVGYNAGGVWRLCFV